MAAFMRLKKRSTGPALRFSRAAGVSAVVFLTDQVRVADPVAVCRHLPAGSIVICRDYNHVDRLSLAKALRQVTRRRQQYFLVAGDVALARQVAADGVHLPEYQLKRPANLTGFGLVSAACHSRRALDWAHKLKVDFALVSPVFVTESHPDGGALGVHRFSRLIAGASVPVVALGGISAVNARALKGLKLQGLAAIGAFADGRQAR